MNTTPLLKLPRRQVSHGFTLLELLVTITIITILAALTIGAFSNAQVNSSRDRTKAYMTAIKSGLEQYKEKWGEYPDVANPGDSSDFSNAPNMSVGGAKMLYQALTGDGNDSIKLGTGGGSASDGVVSVDEAANAVQADLPKAMIYSWGVAPGVEGPRCLIDGFSHPFQYEKAIVGTGATSTTINPTYDLWSFGNSTSSNMMASLKTPTTPVPTTWINNW